MCSCSFEGRYTQCCGLRFQRVRDQAPPVKPKIQLTPDELGALLTEAARLGLKIGRAGTEGDYTAGAIAGHVYVEFIQERAKNPNG